MMDKILLTPEVRNAISDALVANSRSISNAATSSVYSLVARFLRDGYGVGRIQSILEGNIKNLETQFEVETVDRKPFLTLQGTSELIAINKAVKAYLERYGD